MKNNQHLWHYFCVFIVQGGGVTYIKWGSNECGEQNDLLYTGRVGGTVWNAVGGGSNYLCMPDYPEYGLPYMRGVQGHSPVFGTEYEQVVVPHRNSGNAVCALCYVSNKFSSIMIPARLTCPRGWTKEYYGYLMSTSVHGHYRTEFVCVDQAMSYAPGSRPDSPAAVFYHTEASCTGMPCGRYNQEKELNCVVCTK